MANEESKSELVTPKVTELVAKAEFARFAEAWDLDTDTASMKEDDRDSFESLERRLVRKITTGALRVNDGGGLTYKLIVPVLHTDEVTFSLPTGDALLTWDKYKEHQQMHKLNAFMANTTGQPPVLFSKMDGRDLKVCQGVALLFLGS